MKKFNHLKVPHFAVFLRYGGHAHFQDDKDHVDVLQARLDVLDGNAVYVVHGKVVKCFSKVQKIYFVLASSFRDGR